MENTVLNNGQQAALKMAIERYNNKAPFTYIAGAAGTGKSTLVAHIVAALGLNPKKDVCYATYTGKAALNLQRKECPNACTMHSLLYDARQNKYNGNYVFIPKAKGKIDYKLIIIDEISMVTQEMWDLALTHEIPIICLGDIAQLPAIGKVNDIVTRPHVVLNEIMRQEADSEIVQVATLAREHKPIPFMKGSNVQVLHKNEFDASMLDWADVVICATNKTRNNLNTTMRERLWGDCDKTPRKGDKVVCLHNEWDFATKAGDTLVNGLVGYINNDPISVDYPYHLQKFCENFYTFDFIPDFRDPDDSLAIFKDLKADSKIFTSGIPTVNEKNFRFFRNMQPMQFDYAYALTCHKCQGSEYGKVLVIEEGFPFEAEQKWKWLYTACTRAVDKLVIIRNS